MSYLSISRKLRTQKQDSHKRSEELLQILSAEFNQRLNLLELSGLDNDEAVRESMSEVERLPEYAEWKGLG